MSKCRCPISMGNTGLPNCVPIQDLTVGGFYTNAFTDAGVRNSIPAGTVIDDAFIAARLNDPDPSSRWYPILGLKQVTDERADPTTEDIDGISYVPPGEKGSRAFKAFSPQKCPTYLGQIERGSCVGQLAVYGIDASDRIIVDDSGDGTEFYPHLIEPGTFWVRLIKTQKGILQKVEVNFVYSPIVSDKNIKLVSTETSLSDKRGLLDVDATFTAITTTGFTAALALYYGFAGKEIPVTGWDIDSFVLTNKTTPAVITPTSVTPDGDGSYVFVIPAATAGDELLLTQANPERDGFELSSTVEIPV